MQPNTDHQRALQRIHIDLMRNAATCLFSGVIMRGDNSIVYDGSIGTAATDGKNKWYEADFMFGLTDVRQQRGLVLHENLHDALMHSYRDADLRKKNAQLYNAACDYVINALILSMNPDFITLPESRLYDPKFSGWDVRKVFTYLYEECESPEPEPEDGDEEGDGGEDGDGEDGDGDGGGEGGGEGNGKSKPTTVRDKQTGKSYRVDTHDSHDFDKADSMTPEQVKKEIKDITETLQQGGILAGMRGAEVPRIIADTLVAKVDWKEQLRDFVSEACKGRDDYTWRTYNRRRLADDYYFPSTESETIGEVLYCIDTSGSIDNATLSRMGSELYKLCVEVQPSMVRVLWWDTDVRTQQVFFPEQYDAIAKLLKPSGGGGTRVSCVSEFVNKHRINPEAVIVLTDGYVESSIKWDINVPTLWVLTPHHNDGFAPSKGIVIRMDKE